MISMPQSQDANDACKGLYNEVAPFGMQANKKQFPVPRTTATNATTVLRASVMTEMLRLAESCESMESHFDHDITRQSVCEYLDVVQEVLCNSNANVPIHTQ